MHKTTALYCRTALADAEAIARQYESLRRFAEGKGFTNLTCYEDDGYSGMNLDRPAFLRLEQGGLGSDRRGSFLPGRLSVHATARLRG